MITLPVFFRPEQVAPREAAGLSPSAAKPEAVVTSWRQLGIPIEIHGFQPVTRAELATVHDTLYVHGVLNLETRNGFGNFSEAVAEALPYTSGSFVAAALHAFQNGGAAVSPTSGFHHAGYDDGGDFCTFNGLALAARQLLASGAKKVGILDCDAHFGDGTEDILERVPALAGRVLHFTRGMEPYAGDRRNVPAFLAHLPVLLEQWKHSGVDMLLYQAGADPHVDDRVGCRFLTTEELLRRDVAVFEACARLGLPVAWNLAGGYQEDRALPWPSSIQKVLDIHDNTLRACAAAFLG